MCWYKDGLKFKCKKCSNCCTGYPGYVFLEKREIDILYKFLKISKKDFLRKYTRFVKGKISLKENFKNYDCCFLKDKKCTIYDVRPMQCKKYPWWKDNLRSKEAWDSLQKDCPGINNQESLRKFSKEEIQKEIF